MLVLAIVGPLLGQALGRMRERGELEVLTQWATAFDFDFGRGEEKAGRNVTLAGGAGPKRIPK